MLCTGFVNVENDVMFRFSNLAMNSKIISTLETLSCMWILKIDGDEKGMNCGTQRNVTYHEGPPYSRPSQSGYWKHYIKWKQQPWRQLKVAIVGREARAHVLLALHMLGTGLSQELLNFNRSDLLSRLPKPLVWAAKQTWFLLWSVKKTSALPHNNPSVLRGKKAGFIPQKWFSSVPDELCDCLPRMPVPSWMKMITGLFSRGICLHLPSWGVNWWRAFFSYHLPLQWIYDHSSLWIGESACRLQNSL